MIINYADGISWTLYQGGRYETNFSGKKQGFSVMVDFFSWQQLFPYSWTYHVKPPRTNKALTRF